MRQFFCLMVTHAKLFSIRSQADQEIIAKFPPISEPLHIFTVITLSGFTEELQFHLLDFSDPEDEIAGSDFIAKCFADLADTKGRFPPAGNQHIFKIDKNT